MPASSRWTQKNPLLFGRPDGRVLPATATAVIRGLRPGQTFFVGGDGVEAAEGKGYFRLGDGRPFRPPEPQKPVPDAPAPAPPAPAVTDPAAGEQAESDVDPFIRSAAKAKSDANKARQRFKREPVARQRKVEDADDDD